MTMCGVTLHLHVLNDGRRIIDAGDFEAFFRALEQGAVVDQAEADAFARWERGGALEAGRG
jgi:hypothetical protein